MATLKVTTSIVMKIRFKKKRLYANLIIGIVWTLLGIYSLLEDDNLRWSDYGYLIIGLLYIGHYLYDLTTQYLTIEKGSIRKNGLYGFGKKINLNDINWIKKFASDYILKTKTEELIDKNSLNELNAILEKLNLPANKTPFTSAI